VAELSPPPYALVVIGGLARAAENVLPSALQEAASTTLEDAAPDAEALALAERLDAVAVDLRVLAALLRGYRL
jgi:hypothetical protein